MRQWLGVCSLWLLALPLHAQQAETGAPLHADSCAVCHGSNGVSVAGNTPNLAAQPAQYLAAQLRAYRSGNRQNALMNALAAPLADSDIDALAAFYAALPGAADGSVRSAPPETLLRTDFPFFGDYESEWTRYHTAYPGNQVRHYYANPVAVQAAREGRPLPDGSYVLVEIFAAEVDENGEPLRDDEGHFVPGDRVGFNAMAREEGWGEAVPALLRNENWNYAGFSAEGVLNRGASPASCLACHLPVADDSYVFTLEQLSEAARSDN